MSKHGKDWDASLIILLKSYAPEQVREQNPKHIKRKDQGCKKGNGFMAWGIHF